MMETRIHMLWDSLLIKSKDYATAVLSKQPWFFNGGLLLLEVWPDTGQWKDFKLDQISCWINLKGMFLKMFTQKNLRRLGEMAEEIEDFKWYNDRWMFLNGYVRMRIGFPLNRSLFAGRFIPSDGHQHWVQLKFERLSMLCCGCGRWGHEQKECDKPVVMEKDGNGQLVPKYGSWLKDDDPIPNCFVAFKQSQLANDTEANGLFETGGREESLLRDDRGRGVQRMENNDGSSDDAEAVRELAVGGVLQGERGEKRVLGRGNGLDPVSPSPFNEMDNTRLGRGSERKSDGGGSTEELDRERRYFNKGKQVIGDGGIFNEKSGFVYGQSGHGGGGGGTSKHNGGQRRKISIKNRARNLAKSAPAETSTQSLPQEMQNPATLDVKDDIKIRVDSSSTGHIVAEVAGQGLVKTDFTWCNEHESDSIMERRDRGLCNREWMDQFEGADIQLLDWWESDHRALVVDIPVQDEVV
ncbi:hypothetical protein G4B88_024116 [Cannabis sativa]|uniref:Zinc knuckle CX2CX4HX4C domain-containing protein n=1 Tax=Cannabis sativa TaxID=3483 RepID=A0A7J6H400_CANSA|nr:hypothetical protein G4B88_024116 [Cannabis sativa]